jgi:predicted nucleic-acid-binding protein
MLALDTNIVVRFLTRDDAVQSPKAYRLITSGPTFVADTVLLETEWVLRSLYGFGPARIAYALRDLVSIDGVTVERPDRIAAALDYADAGLDFADALHLARAAHCEAFVTFDKSLVRAARGSGAIPVRAP